MTFHLTEDQATIQQLARDFAQSELAPIAAKIDQEERIPKEIIEKMAEIGFTALNVPEAYGGPELDTVCKVLVVSELAKQCASTAAGRQYIPADFRELQYVAHSERIPHSEVLRKQIVQILINEFCHKPRKQSRKKSDEQSLHKKRCLYKGICRSDYSHYRYFLRFRFYW